MVNTQVHPTAIVDPAAMLADGVVVGPFCSVGAGVVLGENVQLKSHVVVEGRTDIGAGTRVFPFTSIGHEPQDLKYHGEASAIRIGANCTIRENVTINPGTEGGRMLTSIGDNCLLMASAHVAHDCQLGNSVIVANYGGIAGHCVIGDFVTIGGSSVFHQYVRVGSYAFIGACSMVDGDVIPYGMALGNRAKLAGLNLVGLKRRGFDREDIHALRASYRMIFASEGTLRERVEDAANLFKDSVMVQNLVTFISEASDRPICVPRNGNHEE